LAAREVSRSNRGRRRAPRERSDAPGIRRTVEPLWASRSPVRPKGADPGRIAQRRLVFVRGAGEDSALSADERDLDAVPAPREVGLGEDDLVTAGDRASHAFDGQAGEDVRLLVSPAGDRGDVLESSFERVV